jgi:hypothetical protein
MSSHEASRNASPLYSPRGIMKRVSSGNSLSSLNSHPQHSFVRAGSARASLVGRRISVPYSAIIDDDYSGCTCESIVLDKGSRGYLVVLAGEKVWKPESFIRLHLCPMGQGASSSISLSEPDDLSGLFREFMSIGNPPPPHSTSPPLTSPPLSACSSELSRVPTATLSLESLAGGDNTQIWQVPMTPASGGAWAFS